LGIGFALGPLAGGLVGRIFGPNALFGLYALPQLLGLIFIVLGGAHRARTIVPEEQVRLWREGRHLLSQPWFLASCLAICQSFFFLVGVTRVAFPFLAANQRGMGLDRVGTIVSASRLADTLGRYTGGHLCDRVSAPLIIVTGVLIGIPMFALQPHGADFMTLLLPLCVMTLGFGFTNVGATTFALQSAGGAAKGISLGLTRASSSIGQMLGPLAAGALIDQLGYEQAFEAMAAASLAVLVLVWAGLRVKPAAKQE
jgi:predicted MFS family arabinose efflux permease